MKSLVLIFPDQLSRDNKVLNHLTDNNLLLLYEPVDTFYEISHHKHKLVFQISSFRHFINNLKHENFIHEKISKKPKKLLSYLKDLNKESSFSSLYVEKPSDYKTLKDLMYFCQSEGIKLEVYDDSKFISTTSDYEFWSKDKKSTVQEFYYRWLRKKLNIFMDENRGDCFHCHGSENNPLWTDNKFHNNGLDANPTDLGLALATGDPNDNAKFKSPSLRNLAFTAPYMHDGRFATLEEVIDHYSEGLQNSATVDPLMKKVAQGGVQLNPTEKANLKAFLLSLSDFSFINNPEYAQP